MRRGNNLRKKQLRRSKTVRKITALVILVAIISICCFVKEFKSVKMVNTDNYTYKTLLINRTHRVTKSFKPNNLVIPEIPIANEACQEERHVDNVIVNDLKDLFHAAYVDGYNLYLLSGYRLYETQDSLYESRVDSEGKRAADKFVAKAGQSEHESGLALDVTNDRRSFVDSAEAMWLKDNAYKYGFIIRYPKGKEDITGYNYEAWHIRYVGKEAAQEIYQKGITLEEYLKE